MSVCVKRLSTYRRFLWLSYTSLLWAASLTCQSDWVWVLFFFSSLSLPPLFCVTLFWKWSMCVSSALFQTHRHTWTHAQKLMRFHCCLPRSLVLANPPDFASHHDGSRSHLSPSPWPVARGGLALPPQAAWLLAGGGGCLQGACSLEALLMG